MAAGILLFVVFAIAVVIGIPISMALGVGTLASVFFGI